MKTFFFAAALAGVAAMTATASADPHSTAVTPIGAPFNWTGLYIGLNAGGGRSHTTVTNVSGTHFFNFVGDSRSMNDSSLLAGAMLGVQKQFGSIVLGVEAGSAWGTLSQTVQMRGRFALDNYNAKITDLRFISGKFGIAFDRILVYGKGGWATAGVSTQSDEFPTFSHFGTSSERQNGYIAGIGAEYALNSKLIAGIEYSYYNLGTKTQIGFDSIAFSRYVVDVRATAQTVMARVSFKFN